jgi:hypothetical protein
LSTDVSEVCTASIIRDDDDDDDDDDDGGSMYL